MQKQNFEKQVQQKMEDLSFVPSEPVWHKIEEQIRKKKEKRRLILWFLLPVMIAGGYLIFSISNKNEINFTKKEAYNTTTGKLKTDKNNQTFTAKNPTKKLPVDQQKSSITTEKIFKHRNNNLKESHLTALTKSKTATGNQQSTSAKQVYLTENNVSDKFVSQKQTETNRTAEENDFISGIMDTVSIKADDIINNAAEETTANDSAINTIEIARKKDLKSKIKLGFNFSVNTSGITEEIFSLLKTQTQEYRMMPSAGNTISILPDNIKRGIGVSFGISFKKQLAGQLAITSGINYTLFTTKRQVGEFVEKDTSFSSALLNTVSVNEFYRNDSRINKYKTHYQFIQIPVSLEYRLFKKLPLYAGTGLHLMQLVASNHLHYDYRTNVFFKENEGINKTQLHAAASLQYEFKSQQKLSFSMGPQLQYGLTPLKAGSKQKLFLLGLNAKVFFND